MKRVTGKSLFWGCPECKAILQKKSELDLAEAVGFVSCGRCGASFSYAAVYGGQYDLDEVEGPCPSCGRLLRGPAKELLGKPCPACGKALPNNGIHEPNENGSITTSEAFEEYASPREAGISTDSLNVNEWNLIKVYNQGDFRHSPERSFSQSVMQRATKEEEWLCPSSNPNLAADMHRLILFDAQGQIVGSAEWDDYYGLMDFSEEET